MTGPNLTTVAMSCAAQGHVPDTAGVGYCVRCRAPSGERTRPPRQRGPFGDELDRVLRERPPRLPPTGEDDDPDLTAWD